MGLPVRQPRPRVRLTWRVTRFALVASLLFPAVGGAQGFPPAEALARMKLAPGFRVELIASEPAIRQPVAMNFDDRGRLWVIQYLQYPNPAGLKPVKVDRYLRTTYDRVPEPPPKGPVGADRVTILEDSDGDGSIDRVKDFVGGLNLASGMTLGREGVYVVQPPYLLYYPDRDRDDIPDSDPKVLLEGFGMEDAHAFANSLQWGPDGWLYGTQGSTVTANIRGITFQQGIWRYHPVTKEFELFSEGGGNTWGLDFDRHGNAIAGTNWGEKAMLHQVQGAYYVKGFSKHGELQNRHAYGYFEHVPYTGFRGGHVTIGGVIYQANAFPPSFRDTYIAANVLSNAIHWHLLEPDGSTFKAKFGGELLVANDLWFRPVDCAVGPDGSLYVADWYDERANHVDPKDDWDKTNGRIYRIVADGTPKPDKFDLSKKSSAELVSLLDHPNEWHARVARRILTEREDTSVADELLRRAADPGDSRRALEAFWTLHGIGALDDSLATTMLASPHADCRVWSVRLLADRCKVSRDMAEKLVDLARTELSPVVRAQLAASAKRLSAAQCLPIVAALLRRDEDVSDPFIPLLLWWSIEDKAVSDRKLVLELFGDESLWSAPLVQKYQLERIARRYAAGGTEADYAACAKLCDLAPSDELFHPLIAGMEKGLGGRRLEHVPGPLASLVGRLIDSTDESAASLRLAVRLGSSAAFERALERIVDPKASSKTRVALIELMGQVGPPEVVGPMLVALVNPGPVEVKKALLAALARFADPAIPATVLARYPTYDHSLKENARNLLSARKEFAVALLAAVETGKIDPKEVTTDQLRSIALHNDSQLAALIEKHWGKVADQTPGEIAARIHGINVSLRLTPGNREAGKALFTKHCANCHTLFGAGNKIGPDLTGADRKNTFFLLTSVVDPSAVIRKEFVPVTVLATDGRVLTGLVAESTPDTVTLLDAKNERTTLATADIAEMKPSEKSLMPDKLFDELSAQQVRDLMAYLQGDG